MVYPEPRKESKGGCTHFSVLTFIYRIFNVAHMAFRDSAFSEFLNLFLAGCRLLLTLCQTLKSNRGFSQSSKRTRLESENRHGIPWLNPFHHSVWWGGIQPPLIRNPQDSSISRNRSALGVALEHFPSVCGGFLGLP